LRRRLVISLAARAGVIPLVACAGLPAQTVPQATDLPSHPFYIRATWYIGGAGTWDYLTMDPQAGRLYIAHGTTVQVVDVSSGALVGAMDGFYEARQVVLDDTGQWGYVSDGGRGKVAVFDRQTLKKVAEIDTGANPRSMVFDALTRLLFVVRANPPAEAPPEPSEPAAQPSRRRTAPREGPPGDAQTQAQTQTQMQSKVTVIDTQSNMAIGEITLAGLLGFAVGDASDSVYIAVTDRNQVIRFDAQAVAALVRPQAEAIAGAGPGGSSSGPAAAAKPQTPWVALDWTRGAHTDPPSEGRVSIFTLGPECADPMSLAMDSGHVRLFAACNNRKLVVVNAEDGSKAATLPIGPGVDAVGYDADHGLVFTANGGAEGSMTIIRQDVTDTYAVIQTLPTRQRAGELAVDPGTGAVYSVTDYLGVNLEKPGGIGTLEQTPVKGSFQVLKISD
jgi:DNA-binding beta-propeller fold protein YncE